MRLTQLSLSILIITAITIYVYGYDISHYLHNQYLYEKGTILRKETAKKFWDLRFSLYSVIICLVFYISRFELSRFNKMLTKIGFSLALVSSIDKFILKELSFSDYDNFVIFAIIAIEFFKYVRSNESSISNRASQKG